MKNFLIAAVLLVPLAAAAEPRKTPAETVDENADKTEDRLREDIADFKKDVADARADVATGAREKYDALVTHVDALETRAVTAAEGGERAWREARRKLQGELRRLRRDFRDVKSKHDTAEDGAPASHEGMSPTQRRLYPAPTNMPEPHAAPLEENP